MSCAPQSEHVALTQAANTSKNIHAGPHTIPSCRHTSSANHQGEALRHRRSHEHYRPGEPATRRISRHGPESERDSAPARDDQDVTVELDEQGRLTTGRLTGNMMPAGLACMQARHSSLSGLGMSEVELHNVKSGSQVESTPVWTESRSWQAEQVQRCWKAGTAWVSWVQSEASDMRGCTVAPHSW